MVHFDTQDKHKDRVGESYIGEIDGRGAIISNVNVAIDECRGDDSRMKIPTSIAVSSPLIVYGSYARGTAVKGKSDLDIVIPVTNEGSEVSPILSNIIEFCVGDDEDYIIDGFEEWFRGADATVVTDYLKWVMALRFAIGRTEGKGSVVYSIQDDRLFDEDEIVEEIIGQIANGDVGGYEIDINELEASPVKEYNVNLIRDALRGERF